MLDANGTSSIKSVQYYNGLGYPTVSVATTGGGGQTACSLTAYDALGREESLYLPVPTGSTLDYVSPSSIISGAAGFYGDEYDIREITMTLLIGLHQWNCLELNGVVQTGETALHILPIRTMRCYTMKHM